MHAARARTSDRLRRVLEFLEDGRERSTLDIAAGAGVCAVNSCVAELRANGYRIECRQIYDRSRRRRLWLYRMARP